MPLEVVDVCDDDGVSGANLREKAVQSGLFLLHSQFILVANKIVHTIPIHSAEASLPGELPSRPAFS